MVTSSIYQAPTPEWCFPENDSMRIGNRQAASEPDQIAFIGMLI